MPNSLGCCTLDSTPCGGNETLACRGPVSASKLLILRLPVYLLLVSEAKTVQGLTKGEEAEWYVLATDNGDRKQLLIDFRIEVQNLKNLLGSKLFGKMSSVPLLPEEFSCPQERSCLLCLPTNLEVSSVSPTEAPE